ncbi:RNA polymerase sigma factor [Modicisalibacter xianhensis]|uniref:RNA polymerase sigma-70 factor, ECF subfamily n=2 Tax=Modicisalibacter xianhensis TaxID=442341 RepID=A0A1I3D4Q9_9GAMM|nr:RNA polymerase sigma factor [Halomonas xianhensis]SFH81720.1 RNA polymerase sigma-70 factor, ECF subfamily [Halomonas xianhensis]
MTSTLDQLFQEHSRELAGYLARKLDAPDLAADLCQEVYLRLRRSALPDPLRNPRAYLFRIARNLLIDHQRQRGAQPETMPLDDPTLALESTTTCPETAVSQAQRLAQVRARLSRLPSHVRQALLWHRLDGLPQREIAQRLGVSERMAGRYITQAIEACAREASR